MLLLWCLTWVHLASSFLSVSSTTSALQRAVPVPGDGRDDWKILRAASEVLGKKLPYDTLEVRLSGRFFFVSQLFGVQLVRGAGPGFLLDASRT